MPTYDQGHIRHLLDNARKVLGHRRNRDPNRKNESESIYLGDLVHFCEEISRTWSQPTAEKQIFMITQQRDEALHYLQDAFEIPYWEFMLDLFLGWRANSNALSGEVVLRV